MKKEKTGENRIRRFLGALMGYLMAVTCIVIFALFCSGRVGWFLLLVAVGAPLLSIIWAAISAKYAEISLETDNKLLERGAVGSIRISVKNRFILPIPELWVRVWADPHIDMTDSERVLYTVGYGESSKELKLYAMYAGLADIRVEKTIVRDFFGIVSFKVKRTVAQAGKAGESADSISIGILPENINLEQEDDWLADARRAAFDGEEPEDTISDKSVTFGGFPGYEHREYIPGDPLKRINYKLSARLKKYMVRLDEQQAVAGISLLLGAKLPKDVPGEARSIVRATAACLEELIGLASHLFMLDYAVSVYLPGKEPFDLREGRDIEALRDKLAMERFYVGDAPGADMVLPEGGTLIACVAYNEDSTIEELKKYSYKEGNNVSVYVSSIEKGRRL